MPFQIPNNAEVTYVSQAEPDRVDFDALGDGIKRTGVLSGCGSTITTTDLNFDVGAGVAVVDGTTFTVAATRVVATPSGSAPRFGIVSVGTSGVPVITHGTAQSNPAFPSLPSGHVLLYAIYLPTSLTAITATHVQDKRVEVPRATAHALYVIASDYATAFPDAARAADYVCDGTGDEVEINAALAALPSTGGRLVLSPGLFSIQNPIQVSKNAITIEGSGVGDSPSSSTPSKGTMLEVAASGATGLNSNFVLRLEGTTSAKPSYGPVVRHLVIRGASRGTTVGGLLYRGIRGMIFNVQINTMTGDGVYVRGYTAAEAGNADGWSTYDSEFAYVQSFSNAGRGFYVGESRAEDCHFVGCLAFSNTSHGAEFTGSSQQVVNCHFYSNGGNGILIGSSNSRTKISNCKIEHNLDNLVINGFATQVSNCGFKGMQTTGGNVHILIGATASSPMILGCWGEATGDTNTRKVDSFLSITAGAQRVIFVGNNMGNDYLAAPIVNNGTTGQNGGAIIRDNRGWFTETQGTVSISGTTATVTHLQGNTFATLVTNLTPRQQDIYVTPMGDYTPAVRYWVSNITSTTFQLNLNAAPTSATTFAWQVNRMTN